MIGVMLVSIVMLVINLALLVWVVADARKSGQNAIAWGIGVILLGPLAALLYFLVGRGGGGGRPLRRTVLIPASVDTVYRKCFQWFGLQGIDITEQMKNQKLVGQSGWKLTLTFEKTDEGTYVIAEGNRKRSMEQLNQLLGILSMLEETRKAQPEN